MINTAEGQRLKRVTQKVSTARRFSRLKIEATDLDEAHFVEAELIQRM